MRTREEIKTQANKINGILPGIPSVSKMLALILEVLLDIREADAPKP
jgi:hypothetical protein